MPQDLLERLGEIGLRVLIAVAVLVVGRVLAGLGRRLVDRLTNRPRVAKNLGPTTRTFLAQVLFVVVMTLAVLVALSVLGVPDNVVLWGVGAALIVLAVALSRSLGNLAATVIFIIFRPFELGDDIETMGVRGVVEDMQLFNTLIRRFDHTVASLPNGAIQEAGLVNHSRRGVIWAQFDFTVPYGQDLAAVRQITLDVIAEDPRVLETPPPEVVVLRLGAEGVVLQALPTVRHQDYWPALSELQHQVATRLAAAGIDLAVPPELPVRVRTETRPAPTDAG